MTLISFLIFVPSILTGSLIAHLSWPERRISAMLMKLFIGIGLGLGLNSILQFVSLLTTEGNANLLVIQGILSVGLLIIIIKRDYRLPWSTNLPKLTSLQKGLLSIFVAALILMVLMFNNIYISRPQGGFDAWSIWNRAARFIYRDPENWQATLSPEIYWGSHPDYPLLIPMNVAWGWDILNAEVQRVPMIQGLLFSIASVGVLFSSLAFSRTTGQGILASLILMSTSEFIGVGAAQVSDIPVSFFILTSSVILYMYFSRGDEKALILCGILAGLAGWTKNEGILFIAVCPIAIMLTARKSSLRPLLWYLAGLSIPLLVLLYFKSIASPGDLFSNDSNKLLSQITDPSRYLLIVEFFLMETIRFGGVFFPVYIILFVYAIFVRSGTPPVPRAATSSVLAIVFLQLIGYGAVYILTPHDLEWHLFTSLSRLILHIYPISLFLLFSVLASPEEIF